MPTPLMWNALDRYERCFQLNWNCPYRWDAKSRKLVYNGELRTLKGWTLAILSTALNLSALVGCLGACNFSKRCSFALVELMIIAVWTGIDILCIWYDCLCLLYFEDAVLAFNRLKDFHSVLVKRGSSWGQQKLDVVGMSCHGLVMTFAVYPYFLIFFGIIIFNVDPLYYASKQLQLLPIFTSHLLLHLTFICSRALVTYLGLVQGCRVCSVLGIVAEILLGMITDCVRELKARAREIEWEHGSRKLLKDHAELEIILKMTLPILSPALLGAMGGGLLLFILVTYATLKFHGTVPMPLYLIFPSLSILIPIVVQIILPAIGVMVDADKKLHEEWAYHAKNSRSKRYLTRKLRSVQALKVYAGLPGINIFPLLLSTTGIFYMAMISHTITALLSFK